MLGFWTNKGESMTVILEGKGEFHFEHEGISVLGIQTSEEPKARPTLLKEGDRLEIFMDNERHILLASGIYHEKEAMPAYLQAETISYREWAISYCLADGNFPLPPTDGGKIIPAGTLMGIFNWEPPIRVLRNDI
ncbi:MAG: hypothetical protein JWM96_1096 [Alphaproteobacteria bacterium]|nr:hypothetical protein [Alphaproteobacteria bacterium]